ncbi:MAG: hypothetical protein U5K37_12775 [Natrialbaceae archaeon]|nr:hypothetical protein [Natrialbaceae archaeon]
MSSSSSDVFLVNCDPAHFDRTVATGVSAEEVPVEASDGPIRVWGLEGGDQYEDNFAKIGPGDLVLFYADDSYVGTALVEETLEDAGEWTESLRR